MMPLPAVIHWTSPAAIAPWFPMLSPCSTVLAHVFDVDEGIPVNASKAAVFEAILQGFECLSREILLPRGQDPNQVSVGLKRIDFVPVQKEILLANPPDNLPGGPSGNRLGELSK